MPSTDSPGPARQARLDRCESLMRSFAEMTDRKLTELIEQASVFGSGIGGTRALVHVDGVPVFVKRIPLTELERYPGNVRSTANLFDLPAHCHYGVGSPSFSAWRELAANTMTTAWVRGGRSASFPLMYESRVLEGPAFRDSLPDDLADIERLVAYWHGSSAVRQRVEAIAESSATVTLFLEYLPQVLPDWIAPRVSDGSEAHAAALSVVEDNLREGVSFMNASGLFHFDAHFGNILADDQGLYFADFGLAASPSFDLSGAEARFLAANRSHDVCHTMTRLVDWLVTELTDVADLQARDELIRRCADGNDVLAPLPATAAAIVERYAPIAAIINGFYRQLHLHDRATPYPTAAAEAACTAAGIDASWPTTWR